MDELRLSLIIIGVVIVGGVYMVGKMVERSRSVRATTPRVEPEIASVPVVAVQHDFVMQLEPDTKLQFQPPAAPSPVVPAIKAAPPAIVGRTAETTKPLPRQAHEPDLIVSLTVMAPDRKNFNGSEVHRVLQAAGLELAEFDIYHFRDAGNGEDSRAVFSVANIVNPGTFDVTALDGLNTPGLAFFMQIPGPMTASEAFDTMLERAQYIAQCLHGVVGDEQRTPLSSQRIRQIRERTLNHDFAHVVHGDPGAMRPAPQIS